VVADSDALISPAEDVHIWLSALTQPRIE